MTLKEYAEKEADECYPDPHDPYSDWGGIFESVMLGGQFVMQQIPIEAIKWMVRITEGQYEQFFEDSEKQRQKNYILKIKQWLEDNNL